MFDHNANDFIDTVGREEAAFNDLDLHVIDKDVSVFNDGGNLFVRLTLGIDFMDRSFLNLAAIHPRRARSGSDLGLRTGKSQSTG